MASSRACSITSCKRPSRALYHCCQQNVCIDHLKENSDLFNAQLPQLADEINELFDQFRNAPFRGPIFLAELDKWCKQAHRAIDRFCERKKREFEKFVHEERNGQKIELDQLRYQINRLVREQAGTQDFIDAMSDSIRSLQQQINQFQHTQLTLFPLVIGDQLVTSYQKPLGLNDLLPLSPPYRTTKTKIYSYYMAANDNYILVDAYTELWLLNRGLIIEKRIRWTRSDPKDLFWSKMLARFIIITWKEVFTLDEKTMTLGRLALGGNKNIKDWRRGACSNNSLFLLAGNSNPSIYEYNLRPSIRFVKEHQSTHFCTRNESIDDISSNNIALAFIIVTRRNDVRLDLCSPSTLERYWSIQLGSIQRMFKIRCCSLNKNQWLVINENNFQLLHISVNGKLVKKDSYKSPVRYAIQVDNDVLAILTDVCVNLHQLS